MTEDYELKDDVHRQQYEFRIGNYTPKIEYIKSINGEIYLTHTEVPRELEGKGIGSQLVEKTLQDIERQGLRLVPLCPFVAAYIKIYKEIVLDGPMRCIPFENKREEGAGEEFRLWQTTNNKTRY